MRVFLAGLMVGAVAVGTVWFLSSGSSEGTLSAPPRPHAAEPHSARLRPMTSRLAPAKSPLPASPPPAAAVTPFAPGEIVLHVGEGYVFGEDHAVPRGDSGPVDIRCLDISGGLASIACPHGGTVADTPLGAVGVPADPRQAVKLVKDAPVQLSPRNVTLSCRTRSNSCGLGIARAATGSTFRLALAGVTSDPDVLSRTARIVYSEIPARSGGGVLAVPTATGPASATTRKDLEQWIKEDSKIPHTSFTNFLEGKYVRLRDPPQKLVLRERKYLVLDAPLTTEIEFNRYSGLVASRGVASTGKVRIRSYTGVAVKGDMAGEIDIESYAYVHVTGDLSGKVKVDCYATLVIDGDLTGEVTVSSYTTLLLRGRLLGKLVISSSGSSFWFARSMSRSEAEALGGASNDLHLRYSDYPAGKYSDWKGWRSVGVGEKVWNILTK